MPPKGEAAPSAKAAGKAKGTTSAKSKAEEAGVETAAPYQYKIDPRALVQEILRLGNQGDHVAILCLLGDDVSTGNKAAARKAFLRISMLVHPDKLSGIPEATSAFQALVRAFDASQGSGLATADISVAQKALARSNEGCFRTTILCPRCKIPWGAPAEGNPDYYYNFMMEGLRSFNCATCLLSFGCVTAIHKCPQCDRIFEYSPENFHQKVTCGYRDCKKPFGFTMFQVSNNALKTAREQARAEFERTSKTQDMKQSRAARAARRNASECPSKIAEAAFAMGFRDVCPRCGLQLEEYEEGEQLRHLRSCNDSVAHKVHKEAQKQRAEAVQVAENKAQVQRNLASSAMFSCAGGRASQLWMLDLEQLQSRCRREGMPTRGGRVALIERLAARHSPKEQRLADDLPRDLYTLNGEQLAAVCAAFRVSGQGTKSDRIEALHEAVAAQGVAPVAAIKGQAKALAIKDRRYLKKQGQRVATSSDVKSQPAGPKRQASPKAKGKGGPKKRARVVADED